MSIAEKITAFEDAIRGSKKHDGTLSEWNLAYIVVADVRNGTLIVTVEKAVQNLCHEIAVHYLKEKKIVSLEGAIHLRDRVHRMALSALRDEAFFGLHQVPKQADEEEGEEEDGDKEAEQQEARMTANEQDMIRRQHNSRRY
jgi:hypothetical protein